MSNRTVTRRSFLRVSAMLTVGGALAACAPTPVPTPIPAPTAVPKATAVPPTAVPPTAAPKATVAPTAAPKATAAPTAVPPTAAPKAAAYKEAPMLAELVKAGKLPPVEQRLPKEPYVLKPYEKVGKYGGTLHTGFFQVNLSGYAALRCRGLLTYDLACSKYEVDIAKSFKWSADAKTLTFELREGHKWSDGAPFTVDDILFWWEDYTIDTAVTPNLGVFWKPGGKPAEFKKVSPTRLDITFAVPYPVATDYLGRANFSSDASFMLPKHYLSKWHIKYNPKAGDLAAEEKRDDWVKALRAHVAPGDGHEIGKPTLGIWIPDKKSVDRASAVRNPYFHQVDTEGNQLPYVDYAECVVSSDRAVHTLKTMAGEFDFETYWCDLKDMPVYKESAAKGNYRVLLPRNLWAAFWALYPNRTVKDPDLEKLFNTKDFRIAMSIGINRKAINDALFFGLATPMPAICMPTMSFFKKEWATKYVEYDVAKANQLLDNLGLTKKDSEGFRLRPDGSARLEMEIAEPAIGGSQLATIEMIAEDWKKIGLYAYVKEYETTLYNARHTANELQVATWNGGRGSLFGRPNPLFFGFDDPSQQRWAGQWTLWLSSGGKSGIEPPEEIKKQANLMAEWRKTVAGTPEFDKLGAEYWTYFAEEIPAIGTVGLDPLPCVVKNNLRNVFDKDLWWSSDNNFYAPYWPAQWYFEN
jgi:peptide/nickel transport system substrate-binding protein